MATQKEERIIETIELKDFFTEKPTDRDSVTLIEPPPFVETSTGALVTILGPDAVRQESWEEGAIRLVIKIPKYVCDDGTERVSSCEDCHQVITSFANSVNEYLAPQRRPLARVVGIAEPIKDGWHVSVICDGPGWVWWDYLLIVPIPHLSFEAERIVTETLGSLETFLQLNRVDYQFAEATS